MCVCVFDIMYLPIDTIVPLRLGAAEYKIHRIVAAAVAEAEAEATAPDNPNGRLDVLGMDFIIIFLSFSRVFRFQCVVP